MRKKSLIKNRAAAKKALLASKRGSQISPDFAVADTTVADNAVSVDATMAETLVDTTVDTTMAETLVDTTVDTTMAETLVDTTVDTTMAETLVDTTIAQS